MRVRRSRRPCFRRKKIDGKAENHESDPAERRRARLGIGQHVFEHPEANDEEDQRRNRVAPGAIRTGQIWLPPAENENSDYCQSRAKGEAELNEVHRRLKSSRQKEDDYDGEL